MSVKVTSNSASVIGALKNDLDAYRSGMKQTVFSALTILEAEIIQNIRSKSGLKVRSGNLLNSIAASKTVEESNGIVTGSIGPEGVPYAAAHEFGVTTKPHIIQPRNSKVLAFQTARGDTFAKFVNHPGSVIPARPYLRPAIESKRDQILEKFGLLITTAFKDFTK